jgi:hypothetical protein
MRAARSATTRSQRPPRKLGRLLVNRGTDAAPCERDGGCQSANPAANDRDLQVRHGPIL